MSKHTDAPVESHDIKPPIGFASGQAENGQNWPVRTCKKACEIASNTLRSSLALGFMSKVGAILSLRAASSEATRSKRTARRDRPIVFRMSESVERKASRKSRYPVERQCLIALDSIGCVGFV